MSLGLNTFISLVISIFMSFGSIGSSDSSPQDAVGEFFSNLTAGNINVLEQYNLDDSSNERAIKALYRNLNYRITDSATNGETTVYKIKISNSDFSGVLKSSESSCYDYIMSHLYDDDISDKEALNNRCLNTYIECIESSADSDSSYEAVIFLPVIRNDQDDWTAVTSDEILNKMLSGLTVPQGDNPGSSLRESAVEKVLKAKTIPAYTFSQVQAMDMSKPSGVSVADLKLVTKYKLVGTEEKLYQLEQDYNLNCLFLLGIASHESAYGTAQFHKNNVCGYGYSSYSSINDCLDIVGRVLAKEYLDPSGAYYKGNTIDSVNKTYAADSSWDSKIAKKVTYFYSVISENRSKQLEKLR